MPLCAKCHQNEATIHFTTVVNGVEEETAHLCKDCAPFTGLPTLDLKELAALSVIGKKCEFCGQPALSGVKGEGDPVYWCFECGQEFGRIVTDFIMSERPDVFRRSKADHSFLSICFDPEFQAWSEAANRKAIQILRERRTQDGRDKAS